MRRRVFTHFAVFNMENDVGGRLLRPKEMGRDVNWLPGFGVWVNPP